MVVVPSTWQSLKGTPLCDKNVIIVIVSKLKEKKTKAKYKMKIEIEFTIYFVSQFFDSLEL